MDIVVFRQDRVEHAAGLWAEIRNGRLRQGWSSANGLSFEESRQSWLRAYRKEEPGNEAPEEVLFKTWGMTKIRPGTVIVVPRQPTDAEFLVMRAAKAPGAGKFPCYRFIEPLKSTDDFRHCVYVDADSIHRVPNASVTGASLAAVTGRAYRKPVQFVGTDKYREALLSVAASVGTIPPREVEASDSNVADTFAPKNDADYDARVTGGTQRRTRRHETLVAAFAEYLRSRGATGISTPHPVDLRVRDPADVLFEMKATKGNPCPAVREAIGQLFWYRFRDGAPDCELCVVLDRPPSSELVRYVEQGVGGVMICWFVKGKLRAGSTTVAEFRRWKLL